MKEDISGKKRGCFLSVCLCFSVLLSVCLSVSVSAASVCRFVSPSVALTRVGFHDQAGVPLLVPYTGTANSSSRFM